MLYLLIEALKAARIGGDDLTEADFSPARGYVFAPCSPNCLAARCSSGFLQRLFHGVVPLQFIVSGPSFSVW